MKQLKVKKFYDVSALVTKNVSEERIRRSPHYFFFTSQTLHFRNKLDVTFIAKVQKKKKNSK